MEIIMIEETKCYADGEIVYSSLDSDVKVVPPVKVFDMSGDGSASYMGGYVKDRSYDFILRLADSLIETFRSCGKYCETIKIRKCTDGDGRIFYVLEWE